MKDDAQTDALDVRFADTPIGDSEEVKPGVVVDFHIAGRIVGTDVLDASEQLARGADLAGRLVA